MNTKTRLQKLYSFFGFWTYKHHTMEGNFLVVYWNMFPWFKFYRKYDLFRINLGV